MKHMNLSALVCLSVAAFAQDVQFEFDRSANFSAYKTYHWVDSQVQATEKESRPSSDVLS